ncbi:hypothetical protein F4780DRAFT_673924 [Xylariomycetidae sp. FL0641]|nr:hypothetical protein F4780DRAFT_673924 [Xylariomycetidae sp. FL0641]
MTKIVLSTGNIVSGGPSIIRKPGTYRSNLEFTNSLRSNFLAAKEDYGSAAALQNGNGANGGHDEDVNGNGNSGSVRPGLDAWTETAPDGTLYIPRIDWGRAGLQEERAQYEVTLKLFFLPTAPAARRPAYVDAALGLVLRELGAAHVDLCIASFPGMAFAGDCAWEADQRNAALGDDAEEAATWAALEALHGPDPRPIRRLGLAEFGSEKLARFLARVRVPPAVDQINVKNCCDVPPPLAQLAEERGIELLTHSDCTDILPPGTLRELLGQGVRGAGVLADDEEPDAGLRGELVPEWVVKYTAFVKDRGVIENMGYFAGAELLDEVQ